jgi:alanyl-tRNA synthetase
MKSVISTYDGHIHQYTLLDLELKCIITNIDSGYGYSIERVTTMLPSEAFVFDEIYAKHLKEVSRVVQGIKRIQKHNTDDAD